MKKLLILGAGTAGTMMANHLKKQLDLKGWSITIVDQYKTHYYQPGFLFVPFGIYKEKDVVKKKKDFIPSQVDMIMSEIKIIEPDKNRVKLSNGNTIDYDILIIATGSKIVPEEIEGMVDGGWRKNIFDFYTLEGAKALNNYFRKWKGGNIVINIAEMPIKCPVAPLEFCFLTDWWLTAKNGLRKKTNITYVTPLAGAFTKRNCSLVLRDILEEKKIDMIVDFNISGVDAANNKIISYDKREVEYDLLITIPTNMGDSVIERSGLGDTLNFVPTNKHTLQSDSYENIFVIGDATNLPASKAGSVAHFESGVLTKNINRYIKGQELLPEFDGHANCFIESGFGKGILIDFNYEIEPVEGKFPIPHIGPFSLLKESSINHWGKMIFRAAYWNMLLKAVPIPFITPQMQESGKIIPDNVRPAR
ncbi:MAG: NAD(P)/FAD-dependent oxidoreductase [Nitrospinota bacterium]